MTPAIEWFQVFMTSLAKMAPLITAVFAGLAYKLAWDRWGKDVLHFDKQKEKEIKEAILGYLTDFEPMDGIPPARVIALLNDQGLGLEKILKVYKSVFLLNLAQAEGYWNLHLATVLGLLHRIRPESLSEKQMDLLNERFQRVWSGPSSPHNSSPAKTTS